MDYSLRKHCGLRACKVLQNVRLRDKSITQRAVSELDGNIYANLLGFVWRLQSFYGLIEICPDGEFRGRLTAFGFT